MDSAINILGGGLSNRERDRALLIGIEYNSVEFRTNATPKVPPLAKSHNDARNFRNHLIRMSRQIAV